jgi:O-methyltransferase
MPRSRTSAPTSRRGGGLLHGAVFVKGDVAQTLRVAKSLPERISVLRLDTDWYESTRLELEVLYPRLQPGGVLIVDDYGYWGGARKAIEEYFSTHPKPFFQYVDHSARMGIKMS